MSSTRRFRSFAAFYPFYLREHTHPVCRQLHFAGTSIAALLILAGLLLRHWWLLGVALLQGYAFAWAGHLFFEHNRPATFTHPWFSFLGDWRMWWEILSGRLRIPSARSCSEHATDDCSQTHRERSPEGDAQGAAPHRGLADIGGQSAGAGERQNRNS